MAIHHNLLMNAVCRAFPQEWPSLLPAIEYLYFTTPQSVLGLSAKDLSMGYSFAESSHKDLMMFRVPKGLAETDVAIKLFDSFKELYGVFSRVVQEGHLRDQLRINRHRWVRGLQPGDVVYRRLPEGARPHKKSFPEPSQGPYIVDRQKSSSTVRLQRWFS